MSVNRLFVLLSAIQLFSFSVMAQTDEARQASGLPYQIGGNSNRGMQISGKVTIEGSEQMARKPVVTIVVFLNGVPSTRAVAQSTGHYVVRDVPVQVVTVVFEVDGVEVARQNVVPPGMGNVILDMNVPSAVLKGAKPGVISAGETYKRTDANAALFTKAVEATRSGKDAEAVKVLDGILAADPKDYEAWTELGNIYFRKKATDNSEAAYFKAIELKRDYFVALMNLGKLYFSAKRFDDAILVLSNAVKANAESADAHHFLGESYLAVKKGSLAVPELNAAIKLDPNGKSDLHLRLAALYDGANLKQKAAAEYKLLLEKRPDHPDKEKFEKYISDNK